MKRGAKRINQASRQAVLMSVVWCLAGTAGLTGTAQAQNAATLKAFATEKHLGTPEQALVGVEVRDDNGALVGWGSGFVLRPDGFVALPASICAYGKSSSLHLTIVLYPGTEKEVRKAAPWPYFGKVYLDEYAFSMGYTVAHVPNAHLPALRTATADILHNGDKVKLFWTQRDEASGKFSLPQHREVTLAKAEAYPKDLTKFLPGTVLLAEAQTGIPAGAVAVGSEELGVGLVTPAVLRKGETDSKANDTSTSSGSMNRFLSFSVLGYVSNCVSPVSMTDADFAKRHPVKADDADTASGTDTANPANTVQGSAPAIPASDQVGSAAAPPTNNNDVSDTGDNQQTPSESKDSEAMVAVPGGPVLLPNVVQSLQPDMNGATVACVAPFLIDKYEVTNRQYAAFWNSLPENIRKQREASPDYWPYGWATSGPAFPPEVADVPVIGVRLAGAQAYAKWAGKRLPTPAEWCLAAFGPKGMSEPPDWVKNYIADRQQTWQNIQQAHYSYLQSHPELLTEYRQIDVGRHVDHEYTFPRTGKKVIYTAPDVAVVPIQHALEEPGTHSFIPWLFPVKDDRSVQADADKFSQETIDNATQHLWDVWKEPINLLPVGSRDFDKSPYGAMDMVLNADELVTPGPTWPAGPSSVPDHYIHIGWQGLTRLLPGQQPPYSIFGNTVLETGESPTLHDVGLFVTSLRASRFLSNINSPSDVVNTSFPNLLALLSVAEAGEIGRPLLYWKMQLNQGPFHSAADSAMAIFLLGEILKAGDSAVGTIGDLAGPMEKFYFDGDTKSYKPIENLYSYRSFAEALWARQPKHLRIEMGRAPSLGPPRPTGNNLLDNYSNIRVSRLGSEVKISGYKNEFVIAGGFRCAR